jgi:hypothetical protein
MDAVGANDKSVPKREEERRESDAEDRDAGSSHVLGLENRFALYRLMKEHKIEGTDAESNEG